MARACQMVFLPFCLMPSMFRSLQPKMRPKRRKRPGQPPQTPAELSLMQEQQPLSRGALLFWFSGRRQTLTQGQRGYTASVQPTYPGDITLPNLLQEPEQHHTTHGELGDPRVKPFTLRQGPDDSAIHPAGNREHKANGG